MTLPLPLNPKWEEKAKSNGASRKMNSMFLLFIYIISIEHSKKATRWFSMLKYTSQTPKHFSFNCAFLWICLQVFLSGQCRGQRKFSITCHEWVRSLKNMKRAAVHSYWSFLLYFCAIFSHRDITWKSFIIFLMYKILSAFQGRKYFYAEPVSFLP